MFCTEHKQVYLFKKSASYTLEQALGGEYISNNTNISEMNIEALKNFLNMVPEAFDTYNECEDVELKNEMKQYFMELKESWQDKLTDYYSTIPITGIIPNELAEKRKMDLFDKCQYFLNNKKELLTNYADNEELGLYIVKDVRAPGWWKYKNDVDEVYFNPCSAKVLLTTEWFWENQSSIRLLNGDRIKEKKTEGTKPIYMTNMDFSPFKDDSDTFYLANYMGKQLIQTHGLFQTHDESFKEGDIHGLEYNEHMYWKESIDATTALMEYEMNHTSLENNDTKEDVVEEQEELSNKLKFKPTI